MNITDLNKLLQFSIRRFEQGQFTAYYSVVPREPFMSGEIVAVEKPLEALIVGVHRAMYPFTVSREEIDFMLIEAAVSLAQQIEGLGCVADPEGVKLELQLRVTCKAWPKVPGVTVPKEAPL